MTEHLPGPWELCWEDGKHGVIAAAAGESPEGGYKMVAIVGNHEDDGLNDIRKANAQLIAAAPDLLAACEYIATFLDTDEEWDFDERLLRQAIEKAKGTQ